MLEYIPRIKDPPTANPGAADAEGHLVISSGTPSRYRLQDLVLFHEVQNVVALKL